MKFWRSASSAGSGEGSLPTRSESCASLSAESWAIPWKLFRGSEHPSRGCPLRHDARGGIGGQLQPLDEFVGRLCFIEDT